MQNLQIMIVLVIIHGMQGSQLIGNQLRLEPAYASTRGQARLGSPADQTQALEAQLPLNKPEPFFCRSRI